jgi:hypothetical protein
VCRTCRTVLTHAYLSRLLNLGTRDVDDECGNEEHDNGNRRHHARTLSRLSARHRESRGGEFIAIAKSREGLPQIVVVIHGRAFRACASDARRITANNHVFSNDRSRQARSISSSRLPRVLAVSVSATAFV